jgi:hypothetical protein
VLGWNIRADDVNTVQRRLGFDRPRLARQTEMPLANVQVEMLAHLVMIDHFAHGQTDRFRPTVGRAALDPPLAGPEYRRAPPLHDFSRLTERQ